MRVWGSLLASVLVAYGQTGAPAEAFARAMSLQSQGDFSGAIAAYREVIAAEPGNFGAHANLGVALAHEGEYAEAITEYKKALALAPLQTVPALRQNIGLALYKAGRFRDAAAEFDAVRRGSATQTNAVLLEADCYLRLGEFPRVIELLSPVEGAESGDKASGDKAVDYMLGMAYIRNGQPEKGQPLVDKLMRGGESAETHYLLGSVAFMAKDYPVAVREFGAAVKLDPALPSLESYYGRALLFSGDPDGAAEAFRKQLGADPNDYDANFQLAEVVRFRKDLMAAKPLYTKAITLRPDSVEAKYGLSLCLLASNDLPQARQMLEAILGAAPDFAGARRTLTEVYSRLGMKPDAARESQLAAKLSRTREGTKEDAGLPVGTLTPDFALLPPSGETRLRLSEFRGKRPAVIVFGSYTCPKFRSQVDALNRVYDAYHDRAGFLMVYIREAHGDGSWQSTANERAGISLPDAASLGQKREYASMCLTKLRIRYPAVVDEMEAATEKQWDAFPSRIYVLDRSGKVVFNSLLDQQQFDPAALEAALKAALRF